MKKYYYKKCSRCSSKLKVKHIIYKKSNKTNRAKLQCCVCHRFPRRWYSYDKLNKKEVQTK